MKWLWIGGAVWDFVTIALFLGGLSFFIQARIYRDRALGGLVDHTREWQAARRGILALARRGQ